MSGYQWDAGIAALDAVPEHKHGMYLNVDVVIEGEPVGHFDDELGVWSYIDEPRTIR